MVVTSRLPRTGQPYCPLANVFSCHGCQSIAQLAIARATTRIIPQSSQNIVKKRLRFLAGACGSSPLSRVAKNRSNAKRLASSAGFYRSLPLVFGFSVHRDVTRLCRLTTTARQKLVTLIASQGLLLALVS